MAGQGIQHAGYLKLGDAAVCLQFPSRAFISKAFEHICLASSHEGPTIATIQYMVDDSVEDLLSFARKDNVVYIDRKTIGEGHERIILGMFDAFVAVLDLRDKEIVVRFGSHAPIERLLDDVLQAALQPILDDLGGFILHGACMVRDDKAIVLMGNSGAGKSTTAYNLTRFNFNGYADDAVLVTPGADKLVVWPLNRSLSLRPLSFKLFENQRIALGAHHKVGDKYYFPQSKQKRSGATLEHICFLELSGETETHLTPLDSERTLEILNADNRHFSFMGRTEAKKYARILAHKVPVPLQVSVGTDLDRQGSVFDSLLSGRSIEPDPLAQPKSFAPTRGQKSAIIRQAWSMPNQEPLDQLIPLLGDFDPSIFKLALSFFQTYPLAGIKPLTKPHCHESGHTYDPVPWLRIGHWAGGCKALAKLAGDEVLQKFALPWFKSAPLLYPFLSAQLAANPTASKLIAQAWDRCRQSDQAAAGEPPPQVHLLNLDASTVWTSREANRWLKNQMADPQQQLLLYAWVAETAHPDWEGLIAGLDNLPRGSKLVIVPVLNGQNDIETCIDLMRAALSRGISASLCRQTPLCRLPESQAQFLLAAGAFETASAGTDGQVRFWRRPGGAPANYTKPKKFGIAWVETAVWFEDRPYANCRSCMPHSLGLCRGGFFPGKASK